MYVEFLTQWLEFIFFLSYKTLLKSLFQLVFFFHLVRDLSITVNEMQLN